jgi:polyvinyl alcohol dehydrogenase (cytochrome)
VVGGTTRRSHAGDHPFGAFGNWPKYGRTLHNTFSRLVSPITARTVAALVPAWTFPTGDAVTASPAVVDGVVYVGAWDGFFYALDAQTGALQWQFQVDCQQTVRPLPPHCLAPGQPPPPRFDTDGGLITSSAAVRASRVYVAAGKTVYALRAADGALLWKTIICGNPLAPDCEQDVNDPTRIFSSPALFGGLLFVGHTNEGAEGYTGGIEALDVANGRVRWRFHTDPVLDAHGTPILTGEGLPEAPYLRGCGGVWSSAAVDAWHQQVIFGVADCNSDATPPYHESVLALDLATGRFRWAFRPRDTDRCDFDFGASANILHIGGRRYVGIGGKDGTYYVLRAAPRTTAGELRWSTRVVFGGRAGGFIGSTAFDGRRIYGGTGYGDGFNTPVIRSNRIFQFFNMMERSIEGFQTPSAPCLNTLWTSAP